MAATTTIEWTDATWNPITGCTLKSEGCRHCYAAWLAATRLKNHPSRKGLARLNASGEAKFTGEVRFNEGVLSEPVHWRRPRRIFVNAHGDTFHEGAPDAWIDQIFAIAALCPQHTFQILTKRPDRMRRYIHGMFDVHTSRMLATGVFDWMNEDAIEWPLPNVWLGVSVEDQLTADERVPDLLGSPAAVRFISAEPLLGPVRLDRLGESIDDFADCGGHPDPHWPRDTVDAHWLNALRGRMEAEARAHDGTRRGSIDVGLTHDGGKLDWVIVGGESGPKARPMHPDWARALRDQCASESVAFFFKQWGAYTPGLVPVLEANGRQVEVAWPNGTIGAGKAATHGGHGTSLYRRDKLAAGDVLDGRQHLAMPVRAA